MTHIENPGKYKHLFFDMDNTLTRSCTPIKKGRLKILQSLPHSIIIMSGQEADSIMSQTGGLRCIRMSQYGNHAIHHNDEELWNNQLSDSHEKEILKHIEAIKKHVDVVVRDENDLLEHRGAQISYSFVGHNEDIEVKEKWDPDSSIRLELLELEPLVSDFVDVKIGGTTTIDYFDRGKNKGHNLKKLVHRFNWNFDECLYFGDKLFPGGNDETVIGIVDTIAVKNPDETYTTLKKYFL